MKQLHTLLPFLICILLTSCKGNITPSDPIFDRKIKLSKRIQLALESPLIEELGIPENVAAQLLILYSNRNFKPIWSNNLRLNKNGKKMAMVFKQPNCIGIPANRWAKLNTKKHQIIVKELLLTTKLGMALQDIQQGVLDTSVNATRPIAWASVEEVETAISEWSKIQKKGTWFASKGSSLPDYQRLATSLFYHTYCKIFSTKRFNIPTLKEDSLECYKQAKLALIDKGYLKESHNDSIFLAALSDFQSANSLKPDGVIGTHTRNCLMESEQDRIDRAVLSLDRWRWREPFPERYVWINIPEYLLRLYYNDTLFSEHRIVVGKMETQTPQLSSSIRSIVAFPYWTVPFSICSQEILPAMQNNPAYAARNNFKMFRKDVEIDPLSVNWKKIKKKTFPYRVRQEPGVDNSLGIIKFEFNNKYGVYVHDTPSKGLFKNPTRSYSHGCMRCDDPDSLGRFILRRDADPKPKWKLIDNTITADSLDSILFREEHRVISLKKKIPIQVDYITVTVDLGHKLKFYPDIYGRDKKLIALYYK